MRLVLVILLLVILFGALPMYPYNRGWGYRPAGGVGFFILLLLILFLVGVL